MTGEKNNYKTELIMSYFDEILKSAKCELNYSKDYELLIAVILSAQTTDKKVNAVTDVLFKRYPTLEDLANANQEDVKCIINSLGLASNKSKNIINCAKELLQKHNGKVPSSYDDLILLNGVGRKTANVTRCELFSIPAIAVDTHVERIAKRLNLAKISDTPYQVELKLEKLFPKEKYIKLHHQFIHFGRYYCLARSPKCKECKLQSICNYYISNM